METLLINIPYLIQINLLTSQFSLPGYIRYESSFDDRYIYGIMAGGAAFLIIIVVGASVGAAKCQRRGVPRRVRRSIHESFDMHIVRRIRANKPRLTWLDKD